MVPTPLHRGLSAVSDNTLVKLAQADHSPAWAELLRRYYNNARVTARSYPAPSHSWEDLTQEAYVGLWNAVRDYRATGVPFHSWATVCMKRHLMTVQRRENALKRTAHREALDLDGPMPGGPPGESIAMSLVGPEAREPLARLLQRERLGHVIGMVSRLPQLEQARVSRTVFDGKYTFAEVRREIVNYIEVRGGEAWSREMGQDFTGLGIPSGVLTQNLQKLEKDGVLRRAGRKPSRVGR